VWPSDRKLILSDLGIIGPCLFHATFLSMLCMYVCM